METGRDPGIWLTAQLLRTGVSPGVWAQRSRESPREEHQVPTSSRPFLLGGREMPGVTPGGRGGAFSLHGVRLHAPWPARPGPHAPARTPPGPPSPEDQAAWVLETEVQG